MAERERLLFDLEFGLEHVHARLHPEREKPLGDIEIDPARVDQLLLGPHQLPLLERVDVKALYPDLHIRKGG